MSADQKQEWPENFSDYAARMWEQRQSPELLALQLAVNMLAPLEPSDSRAVSDEFVALASVCVGDTSPKVMAVIRAALNRRTESAKEN